MSTNTYFYGIVCFSVEKQLQTIDWSIWQVSSKERFFFKPEVGAAALQHPDLKIKTDFLNRAHGLKLIMLMPMLLRMRVAVQKESFKHQNESVVETCSRRVLVRLGLREAGLGLLFGATWFWRSWGRRFRSTEKDYQFRGPVGPEACRRTAPPNAHGR